MAKREEAKTLIVSIADFLLRMSSDKSKMRRQNLRTAVSCLETVYAIQINDYLHLRYIPSLKEIFDRATKPVPVKDCIKAETCKMLGNSWMADGQYELAEEEYTKAISLNPWNAIFFCNRAASRIQRKLYPAAITDCYQALKLDRCYGKAYGRLGLAYFFMNRPDRATRCFRKALSLEPRNVLYLRCLNAVNVILNQSVGDILQPFYRYGRNPFRMEPFVSPFSVIAFPEWFSLLENSEGDTDIESDCESTD
ncbi:small glutamine-rich tetratricopeptide repeat-containing protein beta-like [Stegodyphus dumicola]|uniref:small glutamine-rich tetratricopeptide repeat-containing protein beta-like n=1 Tax=Stegodyphus dumicola TaxID=202533 RepID=UPI0015A9AB00|nr:small glutamine-rich tetratricopeptide repeat-containing protein beta-like [Stegodyphus dumicola]